ncbi:MAG: uroporphyrinogen decarboxylase family protein [Candidatus Hodarchaeota archaeon]
MNSRERIKTALNHEEPDKVPIDLGGNVSGIHIKAYIKLLEYLGLEDNNIRYYDFPQQLVVPCEDLLKRFEIDTRYVRPLNNINKVSDMRLEHEGKYIGVYDQFGCFWGNFADKEFDDILYYDPVIHPFSDISTIQDIKNFDWPDGTDKIPFKGLKEYAKKLRHTTDYALTTHTAGCVYEYTTFLFGFTKALVYLRKKPELIVATMEELLKYWIDYVETFLNEVGDYLDVISINGDLAEQAGPFMSLEVYENIIKPIERKLSERIHDLADIKINYHSCGSIPLFIPHWAEILYDACNPVQISAYDMEPCSLKKRYGKLITFWGGACNTQETLPFGTPEQIRNEVKRNLECFKPGGGYVASNIHNITAEVPPQNIVAMFDALKEYRNY